MAKGLYDKAREAFGNGQITWTGDTIKAYLIDEASYTPDLALHQFLSDVPVGARVASFTLTGKTNVAGVLDAADGTFTSVPAGGALEGLLLVKDTGNAATDRLIHYDNTATGLAVTPDGGNINVTWDNGANKIVKL